MSTRENDYRLFWMFDQSSCHAAFSDDSPNLSRMHMNAKPGGKQLLMQDNVWNGHPQSLKKRIIVHAHEQWIPKGLIEVLTERGHYNPKMELTV